MYNFLITPKPTANSMKKEWIRSDTQLLCTCVCIYRGTSKNHVVGIGRPEGFCMAFQLQSNGWGRGIVHELPDFKAFQIWWSCSQMLPKVDVCLNAKEH